MPEYISKESVLLKCADIWDNADETTQTGVGTINTIDKITDFIESLPAADVQPVKHGRWICPVSVGNGIKFCSVCHNEAYWDTDYGQQLFDYCPYCGARMDLKEE